MLVAGELRMMGPIWTAILTILQIQAIMCAKTTVVTGEVGQGMDFACEYPVDIQNNSKYFCRTDQQHCTHRIRTQNNDRWVTSGRFSLYDNTTRGFFVVRVDSLYSEDSGTYWCGVDIRDNPDYINVIQLNVTEIAQASPRENYTLYGPALPSHPVNIIVDKRNLPMFLTVVSCLAALLFVFFFTLCLLITVKKRRQAPHRGRARLVRAREMSSEYVTMKSGVLVAASHCSCNPPDPSTFSNLLPAAHFGHHFKSTGLKDHLDVDLSVRPSPYQNLSSNRDLGCVEEHIYQGINIGSKQAL